MEKEAVDDYRNSCLSNENIRKFLLRLGGEYLCYAARQGFSDDEGSSAILWALVKASLRCLEAVRHVSQDSLCLEVVQAECLISKIVFKYFGDTAGALSRIETVVGGSLWGIRTSMLVHYCFNI